MIGLAPSELYNLELCEFYAIYEGWLRNRREAIRDGWERTRWSTARLAALQLKPGTNVMELFALPWDEALTANNSGIDPADIEARRRRAEGLLAKVNRTNE